MTLDDYLASPEFQVFKDETLRDEAIRAVDNILEKIDPIKRAQLHAIPNIIQGAGLSGLRELAKKQKDKNTREKNKDFWTQVDGLLSTQTQSDISLSDFLQSHLLKLGYVEQEDDSQGRVEQRQVRRKNKEILETVMERILDVYFEHFNCHYFYKTQQQGGAE